MTAAACRCNDSGCVLASRDKRTVEAACVRCTARRIAALEVEAARIAKALIAIGLVLGVALDDKEGAS